MAVTDKPTISLGENFEFGSVDAVRGNTASVGMPAPGASLGPLAPMLGSWHGSGFNMIFRPQNAGSANALPVPAPGDNILELNITTENTVFSAIAGSIPNRGMVQPDIELAGMTYLQQITDVTSQPNVGIHIEPGIWIVVPATVDPAQGPTVVRMASIPHGSTINAQGTTRTIAAPPDIPPVDITPSFLPPGVGRSTFASQNFDAKDTARIPQDLSGTAITAEMLKNPNSVLKAAIAKQRIIKTTEVTIATQATTNIAFLLNAGPAEDKIGNPKSPNAQAVGATATFWIETVEREITIPPHKPSDPPVHIPIEPLPGHPARRLLVDPVREVTAPTNVTIQFTQIQYTQTVFLNFNGLSWPHVSVATLTPSTAITVPPTAWVPAPPRPPVPAPLPK